MATHHDTEPTVLTVAEVAVMWAVNPATVRRWAATGRMPSGRTPTGQYRFLRGDIEAAMDAALDQAGNGGPDDD